MAKATEFQGYARKSGRPGIRNSLLVLNATGLTEASARRIHHALPGSVFASTPFGMGMVGNDKDCTLRALRGMATNPNIGACVVLSADRTRTDELTETLVASGKPFAAICFDETGHDCLKMVDRGVREGGKLMRDLSRQTRQPFSIDQLFLGLECGLSDPTSGLAANPLLGLVTDELIDAGATVVCGETLEWLGAEKNLSGRGVSPRVQNEILGAVHRIEAQAQATGMDLLGINPNAANIRGGLSTIEEKASGSISKSGNRAIQSVLSYGSAPTSNGLHLMEAPSFTPESLTGFVSAGAQLMLFTTGLGNSYTSAICPTIKVSANTNTVKNLPEQIDFDASPLLHGRDAAALSHDLLCEILAVVSGCLTYGEVFREGNEVISRFGPSL